MDEELSIERSMPNPDNEIEERLAKLRGVDVDQIRHPGKGLDDKPPGLSASGKVDPAEVLLLHDHSDYTMSKVDNDEDLVREITEIRKDVSRTDPKIFHSTVVEPTVIINFELLAFSCSFKSN